MTFETASDWGWADEIIFQRKERKMELPEDLYFYFVNKHPILEELIERFSLDLET